MTTTVEVATVPSTDTPGTCIYLHHDKRSYIFGRVAEGTQRAFGSRKIHMGGTEHVFLSGSIGWNQMGGLIGYLLSVGGAIDAAKEHTVTENVKRKEKGQKLLKPAIHGGIGVHGGDNLCHILAACRPVIFRQPISVRPHEFREDPRSIDPAKTEPDWADDAVRVWKVPAKRARSTSPPKRRHEEISNGNGGQSQGQRSKRRSEISDPEVAGMIVERIMFSGSLNHRSVLLPRKIRDLKPTDKAVIIDRKTMRVYRGPFASDDVELPNPDLTAWVFPDPGDNAGDGKNEDVLAINHFPLPKTAYGDTSMSYIVKCHGRRGKFNAVVAKEHGVQPRDFKLLTAGQSVEGKDGEVVTPDMVLGERQPGKGIIIADIASPDFLESFLERPEWESPEMMEHICVMYWILGSDLTSDARIKKFIEKRPHIKHIFCSQDTCPNMITHPGAAEIQTKLRRIDPERFPLPKFDNTIKHPALPAGSPIEFGRSGKKFQLMPRLTFDDQAMAPFPDLLGAAKSVDEELITLAEEAKAEATNAEFLARVEETEKDIPNRDAEIIPLGTGSSVPSKHRNVSATLIRVPGIGNYLLDCGEGTLGQIRRAFDAEETADVLRNLKCIVISHVHADHHMGTASLIKAWYEQSIRDGTSTTLAISCIGRYRSMLEELSQVEDLGFHRLRFPSCPFPNGKDRDMTTAEDLGEENFGLASIKRIPVPHCWRSYGTQLELTSGLRIAYSGDCRPSSAFAQGCKGAHLLVHECTFGDDKQDHAKAKKHSTMAEALSVAREMEARRTLLTHFSQRYSKADSLKRDRVHGEEHSVLLAFDLMRVKLGDFQKAACYVPAVQKLMETLAD
ncbi:putative tRNA processing endoribonuclease Trz1 [Metarhizium anisopliae]